jgi:hypothetical protein
MIEPESSSEDSFSVVDALNNNLRAMAQKKPAVTGGQ